MASGSTLKSKVAQILAKTHVTSREVRLRSVERSGGDAVLGIGQYHTLSDEPVSPQPVVERIRSLEFANANSLAQVGDYRIFFDASISETSLQDKEIVYGSDVLKIVSFDPVVFDATIVGWQVIARTAKVS